LDGNSLAVQGLGQFALEILRMRRIFLRHTPEHIGCVGAARIAFAVDVVLEGGDRSFIQDSNGFLRRRHKITCLAAR